MKTDLTETQEKILILLKMKPLDQYQLAKKIGISRHGIRGRISELKGMGYEICKHKDDYKLIQQIGNVK